MWPLAIYRFRHINFLLELASFTQLLTAESTTMKIEFPGPAIPAEDGGISYRAKVDGVTVSCHFTMEALQDVDPRLSNASAAEQFEASKGKLLDIAAKKIQDGSVLRGPVQISTFDL